MAIPCPTRRHAATIGVVSALMFTAFAPAGAATDDNPTARLQKAPVAAVETDAPKDVPSGDKLGQHDRELLADAKADGTKRVTVMLATDRKTTKSVVRSLEAAGGWVGTINDKLGYVRARLEAVRGVRRRPRRDRAAGPAAGDQVGRCRGRRPGTRPHHPGREPVHADP
jgi:hypothetical protein